MKMINFVILLTLMLFIKTAPAQIISTSQHGTNCMSANLAQGGLLSWNRNGITNNFISSLYVICPVPLEHSAIPAGAISWSVAVDWYLPLSYSDTEGPLCIFRIGQTGFGNPNLNYYENQVNRGFLGSPTTTGYSSTNGFTFPINFNNTGPTNFDNLISGQLLCLVPPGADLISYSISWNS